MRKKIVSLSVIIIFLFGLSLTVSAATYLWPTPSVSYISQYYGDGHKGIDIAANGDHQIVAAREGTVIAAASKSCTHNSNLGDNCNYGMGNYVQIKHSDGSYATYMHMRYGSITVSIGQKVSRGTKIGMMGSSGNSSGQHLHFQVGYSSSNTINVNPDVLGYDYNNHPNPPSNPSISTDMQIYSESETVSFNISAKNATKYTVEMSCNGENLSSKNVSGSFSYTPERTGTYQVRLAASNSAGTVYSDWISFVVGIGSRSTVGDFNGDGRDDYASLYDLGNGRSQWHVFLSTGTNFSEEIWWTENTVNWYTAACAAGRIATGDFNGDGLDDIAVMYGYSQYDTSIHVFRSNGKEFDHWSTWIEMKGGYQSSLVIDRIAAGDFNGDGLDDIAVMYGYTKYRTEIHVFLSTGTVFQGWQTWFSDLSYESGRTAGRFVSGDFNGDGLDDVAAMFEYDLYNSCIHVFLSTGTSFQGWQSWFYNEGSYAANRITGRFTAGDFNGDGLDDVAAMYNYGDYIRIHVWTSAGTIFNTISDFIEETQFYPLCVSGRFHGGDFDGDGIDDIATMYDYSSDHIIFHIYMSEQNKFGHEWWNGINSYDAKKTTNIKGYGNYTPAFTFKKTEIPQLKSAVFAVNGKRVTNTSNSSQTADVIIAKYDNGMLIDIKAETVTFAAKESKLFEVDGNYTIFVWDSLSGMRPLAK